MKTGTFVELVAPVDRVVLTQFSDLLLTSSDEMREYYRRSYSRMPGYEYPTHFMEIPYWIPIVCSMLPPERFQRELLIISDADAIRQRADLADATTVFCVSALDANVSYVHSLASTGARVMIGGYVDPEQFDQYPNVAFVNRPDDLTSHIPGAVPQGVLDYSLFDGLPCIPRYSLSSGCSFRCAFCTVPSELTLVDERTLTEEAEALAGLKFELIFLDDKSFGEAANWEQISDVGNILRHVNDGFEGFIIQTPPSLARRPGFLARCKELGVRYVEFGVETVDDALLKYLRKPFRVRHLDEATQIARDLGLFVIPNLIVGIPNDDYTRTTAWVKENVDVVPVVNVNWLALHYGNVRGDLGLPMDGVDDRDQNASGKSWLNADEEARGWAFIDEVYSITDNYWKGKSTT